MVEIVTAESLESFFQDELQKALGTSSGPLSEEAQTYLINLLANFSKTSNYYVPNPDGRLEDRALALQLFDALQASTRERIKILKRMGDMALYTTGFFGDALRRKLVGIRYYVDMGHTAYASVADLLDTEAPAPLYRELADNFVVMVDLLSAIASRCSLANDQDLLKLYENWLTSGSSRSRDLLLAQGLIPSAGSLEKRQ
jgi:hypothetical protein